MRQYSKALNPYLKTDTELRRMVQECDPLLGGVFWQKVIPIKNQTSVSPGCPLAKHLIHYKNDSWAIRVGFNGDDYAGHVGTAFCPFVAGETYDLQDRKDPTNTLKIQARYIIPVKLHDGWYWRVEYMLMP